MTETPWQTAERIAETHLNELGFFRVQRTNAGADGGLDVVGQGVAAQVKMLRTAVGSPDIQRLRGAAHRVENAVFYAHHTSGYSRSALRVADEASVALFTYDLDGTVSCANDYAAELTSPLWSVQRSLVQGSVAMARARALPTVTKQAISTAQDRLGEVAAQLRAIVDGLPEGATLSELPGNAHALMEEGQALTARHQGQTPNEQLAAAKESAIRMTDLLDATEHHQLEELIHTAWRDELTASVRDYHDQITVLTAATIAWLGPEVVATLHDQVKMIASEDASLTEADVIEEWPTLLSV